MKKCPFCAEEIQDDAIKCRYCGSFLSAAPSAGDQPAYADGRAAGPGPAAGAGPGVGVMEPPFARHAGRSGRPGRERKLLYAGSPSWRAFLKEYLVTSFCTLVVMVSAFWLASRLDGRTLARVLSLSIPLAVGAIAMAGVTLYRRSKVFRVTTTNIESEYGILSKKIDVLELWRCRDVRYRQSLADRILGIAHIDVFTADVTTPHLELVGLPASRQLFEQIRDSIEIQRHSHNVYGVVQ